jgi:putative ABC transport system permease protein
MLSPRWIKLLRDVQLTPGRIAMMLLAIAAGVFGLATMLSSYSILTREISLNYLATNPASATLRVDHIDAALLTRIRAFPGIAAAQASASLAASIVSANGVQQPMTLFVIDDFNELRINTIYPQQGAWPPLPGTLLVERDSLKQMQKKIGDTLSIKLTNGSTQTLLISGTTHDPAMPKPSMSAFAYVTPASMLVIDPQFSLQDLKITVTESAFDINHIERIASQLALNIQQQGYTVERIRIPPPGEHPHQLIMTAILAMLSVFSFIALVLSAILSATMIDGMLAQQVRQIGVMKTIGARSSQIAGLYLSFVLIIGVAATCLGAPAGLAAGRAFAEMVLVTLLNFTLHSGAVTNQVYLSLVAAGVLLPVFTAAFPILKATHASVQVALTDFGTASHYYSGKHAHHWLDKIPCFDRSLSMALRNSLRRRGRLLLTLALLAMAGAMFISSLNVRRASQQHLIEAAAERHYDLQVVTAKAEDKRRISSIIGSVNGVTLVEAWSSSSLARHRADGLEIERTYPDGGHGSLSITAMPEHSELLSLPMQSGAWLDANTALSVVLNQKALESFPQAKPGGSISMSTLGKVVNLKVVGIVRQKMTGATAYVSERTYAAITGQSALSKSYRVVMDKHDTASIAAVSKQIENALARENIGVAFSITESMLREEVDAHFDLLINALLFISILMAAVGALGLASSMSSNIAERTREFGIMRCIGASSHVVLRNVMAEGLLVGLMSFFIAVLLSLPLSAAISAFLGNLLFDEAFPLAVSQKTLWIWLLIVTSGALAASAYPAYQASRLSIRKTLAY